MAPERAPPSAPFRAGTVAIFGRPNVGKSTLLNALLGERIAITSHHPQTTRDRILGVVNTDGAQLALVDTPGVHEAKNRLGARMNAEAKDVAASADVVLVVTDVGAEPRPAIDPRDEAIFAALPASAKVVLAVNKVDRVKPKEALLPVLQAYGGARALRAIVPISAKTGTNVDRVLAELIALLPEGERLYEEDVLTDRPVRFFVAELVREAALMKTRQEIPHGIACRVDRYAEPPAAATGKKTRKTEITVSIHVPKEAHKRIVVGKGGAMIKAIGTAARRRIEALVGGPVVLETHVRVTPEWFDKDSDLADLGYGGGEAKGEGPKKTKKSER